MRIWQPTFAVLSNSGVEQRVKLGLTIVGLN
jgi:hypothetical protein